MWNDQNSSPTLNDCIFTKNTCGDNGGGMRNINGSNPTLTYCTFTGNTAPGTNPSYGGGGGMNNGINSNPTLTNCLFTQNSAIDGGGMYNSESSPTMTDCTFAGNNSENYGGGMCNTGGTPTLENCTFNDNSGFHGGGMYNGNSNPTVTNSSFTNNTTTTSGGSGGGMYNYGSSPMLTNCLFDQNIAGASVGYGGGIRNWQNSSPSIMGCTLTNNSASSGGGMRSDDGGNPMLTDTTVCGNTPDQIYGDWTDGDGNAVGEFCWLDCNENGIDDAEDIANQTSFDCDANGVPDECQPDCDVDGIIDPCDILYGGEADYNGNGIPDNCEVDCNENDIPDDYDILIGISLDCNENGIPDECDLTDGGQVPEGAVQWTIEEGGNGHWYYAVPAPNGISWLDANTAAHEMGGHLATLTSSEEDLFVAFTIADSSDLWAEGAIRGPYLGGQRTDENCDLDSMDWVTGEPWDYTRWHPGNPNTDCTSGLQLWDYSSRSWQDNHDDANNGAYSYIVEYTTLDCNGDGVIDSCQIDDDPTLDCDANGILDSCDLMNDPSIDCDGDGAIDSCQIYDDPSLDCNDNTILDSCELAGGVPSEGAIQWTIEEGGNGHWYQVIATSDGYHPTWNESRVFAQDLGGDMVTFETESELDFCRAHLTQPTQTTNNGAWIGLYQEPGSSEPAGGWYWISGLAASTDWGWVSGEPNDNGGEDKALINLSNNNSSTWFLYYDYNGNNDNRNYFIEWDESSFSLDCNANGIPDECDIADGTSTDINGNDIPDECEVDCNGNSVPDYWDIKTGESQDCNDNGIPDECDIEDGTSNDVNENDIPDECEDDCNGNGVPDSWDIETGAAIDCNGNGIPDSCDVAAGCDADCNLNGVPDSCDLASGTSEDINMNNIPDDCECIADITGDGVVNIHDLLALIGYWGTAGPLGDFNADGIVKIHDLLILIANWGECTNVPCGPPMAGAVQWTIEEGGNGHWYATVLVPDDVDCFDEIRLIALDLGGEMVIIQSEAENSFVIDLLDGTSDYLIGLIQNLSSPDYSEPGGGWEWVDGTPLDNSYWHSSEPGDTNGTQNFCGIYSGGWYDVYECDYGKPQSAVVEWSD